MTDLRTIVIALLADDGVREALRQAIGASSHNAWIPIVDAAREIGVRPRVLRDAARRGEIEISGSKSARVVRRSELDRWLADRAPARMISSDDPRESVRRAIDLAAEKIARSA